MKYHSYSPILAQLHGKKPSWVDGMIRLRSELTHSEKQFSQRYKGVSASATMQDGCKCYRFKFNLYTHPCRWLTTELPMTDEQEDAVWAKSCQMADLPIDWIDNLNPHHPKECFFGPNALKYDLPQVTFGFISKLRIKKGDKKKVFCTEACFVALMEVWPELLSFGVRSNVVVDESIGQKIEYVDKFKTLRPDELHPSLGDMILRDWARRLG